MFSNYNYNSYAYICCLEVIFYIRVSVARWLVHGLWHTYSITNSVLLTCTVCVHVLMYLTNVSCLFPLTGMSGAVSVDTNGDRQMDFAIYNFISDKLIQVARYDSFTDQTIDTISVGCVHVLL